MQLYCMVMARNGEKVPLVLDEGAVLTPNQLRTKVSEVTGIPLADLRLIFRGRMIKDDDGTNTNNSNSNSNSTITNVATEYKLGNDSVLHCMGKPVSVASEASAASAAAAASAASDTTRVQNGTAVPPLSTPAAVVAAASAATTTATTTTSTTTTTTAATATADPLARALERLRSGNPPSVYATAVATLAKVLANIVAHPMDEKYRRVKRHNPAFRKRLGGLTGGHDCMLACGFGVDFATTSGGEEAYNLHASADSWNALVQAKEQAEAAAARAKVQQDQARQQQQQQPPQAGFGGAAAPFGMGTNTTATGTNGNGNSNNNPMAGFPPINANDPNMQNMMSQMMSNPEALTTALQNPMVQQMMRNDPNVSPMMRQYLEQMSNNPAMLQQMTQRMQDPTVRAQVQRAMAAGGSGMGMDMGMGMGMDMPGAGGTNNNMNNNTNNNSTAAHPPPPPQNDQGQTEEEMIAEAIRRSLEDGH